MTRRWIAERPMMGSPSYISALLAGKNSVATALMFLGLVLTAVFLPLRVAMLHVVFIGGFGLIVFLVATRVMFGHSGFGPLLTRRAPFLIVVVTLTLLGW